MKKLALILSLLLIISLSACGNTTAPATATPDVAPDEGTDVPASVEADTSSPAPTLDGEGELGDYYVKILDISLATDYKGKPAVVVTYNWANNGEDTANFAFAVHSQVFQEGIECETAIIMNSDVYDSANYMKDIKPGAALDVQMAFVLHDNTNPITVEVSELISFNSNVISKEFNIA